jgi:nucleoside 2-deoxyribosyltransferase
MKQIPEVHAYLAGPDVFYSHAKEIGLVKKSKLATVSIHGHFPFDNAIFLPEPIETARAIGRANEQMMLRCCEEGKLGLILANMTPYRGPSMDIGTGFEVGFMSALADLKPNVLIIGYTDDVRAFEDRVIEDYYKGRENVIDQEGILRGPDGFEIEAFGGAENLMITHAIEKTGGCITEGFDEAVIRAKQLSDARIASGRF